MADENVETILRMSPGAVQEIRTMFGTIDEIATTYGSGTPAHLKASDSLLTALVGMLTRGGEVWREGAEGSGELGGRTDSGFVFGIIRREVTSFDRSGNAVQTAEWSTHS